MADIRSTILNSNHLNQQTVDVPEWGVKVTVRELTGEERLAIADGRVEGEPAGAWNRKFTWGMLSHAVRDPATGDRVFDDADRDAIFAKGGAPMQRLVTLALKLSGMSDEAADEAAATFRDEA